MQMYLCTNGFDAQLVYCANGAVCLALARPKAGKIMFANKPVGRQLHGCWIKSLPVMPNTSERQRGRCPLGQNAIEVLALRRGKPRVNALIDSLRLQDCHGPIANQRIQRLSDPVFIEFVGQVQVCHLSCCMHPRVGSSGALNLNGITA